MDRLLRALIVEDVDSDALLTVRLLERAGYEVEYRRVESAAEMTQALETQTWDVVICDYRMPGFDAPGALATLHQSGLDLPFLVVSGTVGEDVAVEMMRAGAHDYLMKDSLKRLAPAVEREIREARIRSSRRASEEALRSSEAKLQTVVQSAVDAVVLMDEAGRVVLWNPAAERMFGYSADEALGRPLHELVAPERATEEITGGMESFRRTGQGRVIGRTVEMTAKRRDGSEFPVELSVATVAIPGSRQTVGVVRDIGDRKRAELERETLRAQFLQAQKMESIGRLAGGIAHDFNNLLTIINGYSNLALRRLTPGDPLHDMIDEISKAGERATALVRQLLAFSRKQIMKREILDLNQVISSMDKMISHWTGEGVEIATRLAAATPPVSADRHQIEQVLMNLVINARDAMPDGGRLTIETTCEFRSGHCAICQRDVASGQHVRITVHDTGTGISEEVQRHLFEPFFTTKEVGKGTGLGLAAVQGIVVQSGGHLRVESKLGQGSAFHVYLPIAEGQPEPAGVEPMASGLGNETVLLVEDQPDVRGFAAGVLAEHGYRVIQASGGVEALAAIETQRVDLLVADVVMPGMSGQELASLARRRQPGLKVLLMSGYSGDHVSGMEQLSGSGDFIQKPFTPGSLVTQIREILDRAAPPRHVLVVDDEPAVRGFLREVLEEAGYAVIEADDGRRALKFIASVLPALVITDLVMPGHEGIEMIQTLRRDYPEVPVIAMSGASGGAYLQMAGHLGARGVLPKPFSADELRTEVNRVLRLSETGTAPA